MPRPRQAVPTLAHGDLLELGRLQPEFGQHGVKVIALSSDTAQRARSMADKLDAPDLRIGHSL